MPASITGERLTTPFRPRSVALVGASDKSLFSVIAYNNLVRFGSQSRTYLVNRRGAVSHGQPAVASCAEIGEPVDVAFLMVPRAGTVDALSDAAAAGIRPDHLGFANFAERIPVCSIPGLPAPRSGGSRIARPGRHRALWVASTWPCAVSWDFSKIAREICRCFRTRSSRGAGPVNGVCAKNLVHSFDRTDE